MNLLDISKVKFLELIEENDLMNESIEVISAVTLTPFEAIGVPERDDYPILKGKEVLIEATFKSSRGQAYTDEPGKFKGTLREVLNLEVSTNFERAILIATMNGVLRHLDLIGGTIHCKNEGLGICADELAIYIKKQFGNPKIGLIGLQPGLAQALSKSYSLRIVDLDKDNYNKSFNGVIVEEASFTNEIIDYCDLIVATGSTAVNGSIDEFLNKKDVLFYGTTVASVAYFNKLNRFCYSAS